MREIDINQSTRDLPDLENDVPNEEQQEAKQAILELAQNPEAEDVRVRFKDKTVPGKLFKDGNARIIVTQNYFITKVGEEVAIFPIDPFAFAIDF
ncbi:hypothetical protein A2125_01530 [Candidatus Woesebacteria bacterium GWB1_43_5]|uniref:Uncharacterized protein n=1 Tax=Candidatus Woesebacteria bacterium GWB1_43_5 TaxID=1802474 RepID=A0A1F7WTV4_9BACT|nr:MAG: hypothetical protein A2125_01530 [Candidatus Woesebacteria bacterium GWB1_43_5]